MDGKDPQKLFMEKITIYIFFDTARKSSMALRTTNTVATQYTLIASLSANILRIYYLTACTAIA